MWLKAIFKDTLDKLSFQYEPKWKTMSYVYIVEKYNFLKKFCHHYLSIMYIQKILSFTQLLSFDLNSSMAITSVLPSK